MNFRALADWKASGLTRIHEPIQNAGPTPMCGVGSPTLPRELLSQVLSVPGCGDRNGQRLRPSRQFRYPVARPHSVAPTMSSAPLRPEPEATRLMLSPAPSPISTVSSVWRTSVGWSRKLTPKPAQRRGIPSWIVTCASCRVTSGARTAMSITGPSPWFEWTFICPVRADHRSMI